MTQKNSPLGGRWRIIWMEMWDSDYFDMEVPAHITLDSKGNGEFQFGLVQGSFQTPLSKTYICSEWEGNAEMDEAFGEIYATLEEEKLKGSISFYEGDESEFTAIRE